MTHALYTRALGFLLSLLLASCQPQSVTPPVIDPTVPTRSVENEKGTTQVPLSPERVVVIDTTPLDAALALGIQPVGTIRYGAPPGYLEDAVQDIEVVGEYNQPNLETILRLEPDLILGVKSISERLYPRLSQIAPTVFIQGFGRNWDWKNNFRIFAEALGRAERAEELLADYQQQLTALKSSLDPPPEPITVSVLSSTPRGLVGSTPKSFSGSILQELGFARNATQDIEDNSFVRLSREDLAAADGDVIFLIHNAAWRNASKEEFVNDRLWSQLEAVQQDAVCEVAGDVWSSGRSLLAAQQILQDIEACLARTFPQTEAAE